MGDIKIMVDGGKANAGPPLGPALAPLGVNIGDVVAKINEKTSAFSGMKVPVVVTINADKSFEIKVGLPPMSALIKKEIGAPKGAANPKTDVVGNLTMEQVLKVAEQKDDVLNSYNKKSMAKEVVGTCVSMGVTVEGLKPKKALAAIDEGKFDDKFN
ncbi:MAG: 50S ribosomal protein L11 [Candidatus Diapherotrites archaeon]|uniref:Large ribosomal subunit protein uL11 n=1 Tax=Candidatus Iainarchaeum sp. TaxID=3101447 RepID=A0A8T5GD62_9ARCH|nr:50S ribosomal protein L11 [Candidatus Diapherotrites archaeon]